MWRIVVVGAMRTNPLCDTKPFDLWQKMPPVMQALLPNTMWDRTRLHELVLPVVELPVVELRWMLDLPWWRVGERRFAVTPNQVRNAPERFVAQWRRMLDADLDYPIDLLQGKRLIILDGVHRLLKADVLGMRMLSARVLDNKKLAEITVSE